MLNKINFFKKEGDPILAPHANIYDQGNEVALAVEMPGVDKDSLEVSLDGNLLYLKGRKKKEDVGKDYQIIHQERQGVEYQRVFELNADVDRESLRAEYVNGVLKIFLSKSEKAQPKKIKIKT